jgi:peptidoglycan/LPS O-acetylase OafA/YrhL
MDLLESVDRPDRSRHRSNHNILRHLGRHHAFIYADCNRYTSFRKVKQCGADSISHEDYILNESAVKDDNTYQFNAQGKNDYIPVIDGWRGFAILCVLFFHGLTNTNTAGNRHLQALSDLSGRIGALGVLVFFAISGYLITKRLRVESHSSGTFSLKAFYIKRCFRILPPLIAYLLTLILLAAMHVISLQRGDWTALIFLTNYFPGSFYTGHFWSLSVEEHFYLFWPACVILAGWRRAMWIGVALVVGVGLWRPLALHHVASQARALHHTDMRLDYIMMGCIVALAIDFYPIVLRILYKAGTTPGLVVLFLALLLSTLHFIVDLRSLQSLILTLMVCSSSIVNARIPKAIFANPLILFIGRISYSLYIWQQPFLGPSKSAFLSSLSALPLKYTAVVIVAYLSYRFVERPMIRYVRVLLKQRKVVSTAFQTSSSNSLIAP